MSRFKFKELFSIMSKKKLKQIKFRIGLFGLSYAGKTCSSLELALGLTGGKYDEIAFIDTEQDAIELALRTLHAKRKKEPHIIKINDNYHPHRFVQAIHQIEETLPQVKVIIIDSISPEWDGPGGCLSLVSHLTMSKNDRKEDDTFGGMYDNDRSYDNFTVWQEVGPLHSDFTEAIINSRCHVICCGKTKEEHDVFSSDKGGKKHKKVSTKVITRGGFDYDMTISFTMDDQENQLARISKDRTMLFSKNPFKITQETGRQLAKWNNENEPNSYLEIVNLILTIPEEYRGMFKSDFDIDPERSVRDFVIQDLKKRPEVEIIELHKKVKHWLVTNKIA